MRNYVNPNHVLPLGLRTPSDDDQLLAAVGKVRWAVFTRYFTSDRWKGSDAELDSWLKQRLELFRKYCIPSIWAQREQLSCWYIFAEEFLHESLAEELSLLVSEGKVQFRTVGTLGFQGSVAASVEEQRLKLEDDEYLLCTRLDNDDGLSLDYYSVAASIIAAAGQKVDGRIISFSTGAQLDADADVVRSYPFTHNHFLSSVHSARSKAKPNCLSFNHSHVFSVLPSTLVFTTYHPMWVEVFHDGNLKNRAIEGLVMDRAGAALRFASVTTAANVARPSDAAERSAVQSAADNRRELIGSIRSSIARSGAMKPGGFGLAYASVLSRVECQSILEIGIHKGGSISLWRELLGAQARISCVDINEECCKNAEGIADHVFLGSQIDPDLLDRIGTEVGPFDVIVDDGSHQNPHMIFTLEHMFSFVRPGGAYVIEDMFTSYWPRYRGGLGKKDALMEYVKRELDTMYAGFVAPKYKAHFLGHPIPVMEKSAMASQVESIEFFGAGIIVIHKKPLT